MQTFKSFVKENWVFSVIFCLGTFLRFYHLDYQSVWLDEICSINEANPAIKWTDLEHTILQSDPHPPLYFALLKIFFSIFGYSTFVARSFSAVAGCLGISAIYFLGKQLLDKKYALLAAFLLCINPFHIYYSQEVRMYSLLFLLTVLSFIFLVNFVKSKTFKNAILYGFFAGLMLETQFFGIFVLISQLFILFINFFITDNKFKKTNFVKLLTAGLTIIIIFLPALNIFIATTKKKYVAIQPTTVDTIFQIFKDFVQNSYFLLVLFLGLILFFIYKVGSKKDFWIKFEFSNLLMFSWIFITLAIPIVRSYLVTPMIASRYFITILASILMLVALGVYFIKNRILQVLILFMIFSFTLYQSIFIDNYYNKIAKTQFRETTTFIKENNENNDIVICRLGWYLHYFFKDKIIINDNYLSDILQLMMTKKMPIDGFWNLEAFSTFKTLSHYENVFLNNNFILVHSIQNFDCRAEHYVFKTDANYAKYKIPKSSLTLSNITDENWFGGVGINLNTLLIDYSLENENKLKTVKELKLQNNNILKIKSFKKVDNFLHLQLYENAYNVREQLSYPQAIEIIK